MNMTPELVRRIKLVGQAVKKVNAGGRLTRDQQGTLKLLLGEGPKSLELPVYESLAQCEEATGIPALVLRRAKAAGCGGFGYRKIELKLILPYLFKEQREELPKGPRSQLDAWRAAREKQKVEKEAGLVILKSDVKAGLQAALSEMFGTLERTFLAELPAVLVGMRELEVRARCRSEIELLKSNLKKRFDELSEEKE